MSATQPLGTGRLVHEAAPRAALAAGIRADVAGRPLCPKCGGRMWDNRTTKRNPKAPDFKCRDRNCDGVYWPGQWAGGDSAHADAPTRQASVVGQGSADAPQATTGETPSAAHRACYLAVTAFVLGEVRARYAEAGLPLTDATAAAIAATLYIAACRGDVPAIGFAQGRAGR